MAGFILADLGAEVVRIERVEGDSTRSLRGIRVGLLRLSQPPTRGQLAGSNAEQVLKVRRMLEDHGLEIATPTEARAMLGLKGPDRTRF